MIGHDVDDSRKVRAFINVDGDRLAATYPTEEALLEKYPFAGVTFPLYERSAETAGVNTVGLHADSIDHLLSLLNDNAILDAARYLNYRVMSLGRTVYARYHCYDLADLLVR
ncbi:MAG: hypothetical protein IT324_04725 [Anaerolineae bacterium]|nr:hypothetical protein [Anaerolineae bacterium]